MIKKIFSLFVLMSALISSSDLLARSAKIVIVSQTQGESAQTDVKIQHYLQQKGYNVEVANQDLNPDTLKNNAVDLILISSTVAAKDLKQGWRTLAIPLMTWENDYIDDLAMTGKRINTDFGEIEKERYIWLVNAPHPLSAQLSAGVVNVYKKQAAMSWGKPGLGATIIATQYGQPDKAVIWAYEKGATMDYESLAPAKRLMFFLNNDTFTNLSDNGLKLFDASISWMLNSK